MRNRLLGDKQSLGNCGVSQTFRQQRQNLRLTPGQAVWVILCRGLRAARKTFHPVSPELLAKCPRCRRCTETFENRERLTLVRLGTVQRKQGCLLIGTSKLFPGFRGSSPPACNFGHIGRRIGRGNTSYLSVESICAEQPHRELTVDMAI